MTHDSMEIFTGAGDTEETLRRPAESLGWEVERAEFQGTAFKIQDLSNQEGFLPMAHKGCD